MTLFAGSVSGKRWWLAPNVALLALAALLPPTALLLAPVTLAGVLLAPERPRTRDYTLAAAALGVLLAPTIVREVVGGGSDVTILLRYAHGPSVVDPNVLFRLYQVLGGPLMADSVPKPGRGLGALVSLLVRTPQTSDCLSGTPYGALGGLPLAASLLAFGMFVVGWSTQTLRVLAPAIERWRAAQVSEAIEGHLSVWLEQPGAMWQGLRADRERRVYLLLWLSVSLPPALMLRHAGGIYPHYLIILYPLAFLVSALPVTLWTNRDWMAVYRCRRLPALGSGWTTRGRAVLPRFAALALAALIAGQTVQTAAYIASLASGRVNPDPQGYGIPLAEIVSADERISGLQHRVRATQTVLVSDATMYARLTLQAVSPENSTGGAVASGTAGARSRTGWWGELAAIMGTCTDYDAEVSRTAKPRASNRRT
jgi:hypothetical protein